MQQAYIGGAAFFDVSPSGAIFAEFLRKHVVTLRALVLLYRGLTLRHLFSLKPLTGETVDVTACALVSDLRLLV